MRVEFVGGPLDGEFQEIRDSDTTYSVMFCQAVPFGGSLDEPISLHTWRGEYSLSPITSYGTMPLMRWHGEFER